MIFSLKKCMAGLLAGAVLCVSDGMSTTGADRAAVREKIKDWDRALANYEEKDVKFKKNKKEFLQNSKKLNKSLTEVENTGGQAWNQSNRLFRSMQRNNELAMSIVKQLQDMKKWISAVRKNYEGALAEKIALRKELNQKKEELVRAIRANEESIQKEIDQRKESDALRETLKKAKSELEGVRGKLKEREEDLSDSASLIKDLQARLGKAMQFVTEASTEKQQLVSAIDFKGLFKQCTVAVKSYQDVMENISYAEKVANSSYKSICDILFDLSRAAEDLCRTMGINDVNLQNAFNQCLNLAKAKYHGLGDKSDFDAIQELQKNGNDGFGSLNVSPEYQPKNDDYDYDYDYDYDLK